MDKELKEAFDRFVEFGEILDRRTRQYLVQYLHHRLDPEAEVPREIDDRYFHYFRGAFDDLLLQPDVQEVMGDNEALSQQVVLDTLFWLRNVWKKIETKNPFHEEKERLESWAVTTMEHFVPRWPYMLNYLEGKYPKDRLNPDFFREKFKSIIRGREHHELTGQEKEELDRSLTDVLRQWDALLQAAIFQWQISKLEEHKNEYGSTLQAKAIEYAKLQKLVSPFMEYVGRYWDMSRALWKQTSFDVMEKYDDLLKREDQLKRLADLLGKMREAENELEEEVFEKTVIHQDWVADPMLKSEITGVHESDDLNSLLSSEVGLLSREDTELAFLKKYADKNLLTLKYEDKQLNERSEKKTEVYQKVRLKEKGPFIICVDTSGSMEGEPEHIAKILCFGILKMAAKEDRQAYLINFSTHIETLDLLNLADSVDKVAAFLRMSFHGGTDVSLPLYEAIRQLDRFEYKHADVLVISDFIMYRMDDELTKLMAHHQQNQGTQFHSLTLSEYGNERIIDRFDNNWLYDPREKGIMKSLYKDVKGIAERRI
ncbi:MAG: VWA domain-containing protein [Cyclobacteriaceae bacterium]